MRNLTTYELTVLRSLVGKDQPVAARPIPGAAFNAACEVLQSMGYVEYTPWRITKRGLKELEEYE